MTSLVLKIFFKSILARIFAAPQKFLMIAFQNWEGEEWIVPYFYLGLGILVGPACLYFNQDATSFNAYVTSTVAIVFMMWFTGIPASRFVIYLLSIPVVKIVSEYRAAEKYVQEAEQLLIEYVNTRDKQKQEEK